MHDLMAAIKKVNEYEIEEVLQAVLNRYGELFPDWEVSAISLQKSKDRNEQLDRNIALLQKLKTMP